MRAIAEPGIHQYSFEIGLSASLAELSRRCAIAAIAIPCFALVAAVLLGHNFGTSEGRAADPLMALALGSWVLEPMLALTSAVTALVSATAIVASEAPRSVRIRQAGLLVALSALSVVAAVAYGVYLLPELV